jgi:hypothetical protein
MREKSTYNFRESYLLRPCIRHCAQYGFAINSTPSADIYSRMITSIKFSRPSVEICLTLATIAGAISVTLSTAHAQDASDPGKLARAQYITQQRMNPYNMMHGCTPAAGWPELDLLKFICDDEGYTLKAMVFKDGYKPSEFAQLSQSGFNAVLLTGSNVAIYSSKPDTYLVVTPDGLTVPTPKSIPVDPTPQGRWEYAELMYAKWRIVPHCQATTFGTDVVGIYVACDRFTSSMIDVTLSQTNVAKILQQRGFKHVIYGDEQQFWPATITDAGFVRDAAMHQDQLLSQYEIKSAEVLAKEDATYVAYRDFIDKTVRDT